MRSNRVVHSLHLFVALTVLVLPACGGGGGTDTPDAAPPATPGDSGPPGSDMSDSGVPGNGAPDSGAEPAPLEPAPQVPDWVQTARIGGLSLYRQIDDEELDELLRQSKDENVSVLEIDTRLSFYLTEAEFDAEVAFIDRAARAAHAMDMRAVIYYPSLEVLTQDGETSESSMYKDHPDWVQVGIDGTPNVFYGSQEDWVEPGTESAWMSPNTAYRDYFLARIRKLAQTAIDGVWVDVPVYLDTGTAWAGAEPAARDAFRQWSMARGLGGGSGLPVPTEIDPDDPAFRAWMWWRHENLADFLEDIRRTAHDANPDFMVIIEDFPMDYMDGAGAGLDGTLRRSGDHFIRAWEIDSVSNTRGMQWATIEDFSSKIAMYKWAAACERENPPWSFVYGSRPQDAGLVMAAAVATRNMPFEAKTPEMTESVGSAFRTRWFGFIRDHEGALLRSRRMAQVGVWFSSATRDYLDYSLGGRYGMYIEQEPPVPDSEWWSRGSTDSATFNPHLGGWRGAAHALSQLHIPFKPITDPGDPARSLREVKLLWLPSVVAMSDESAQIIRDFVARGGVVVATGRVPGTLDALGRPRPESALGDVFGRTDGADDQVSVHAFGDGLAIYRLDVEGRHLFGLFGDPVRAARMLGIMEPLIRAHVPDVVRIEGASPGVHVELSRPQPKGEDENEGEDGRQYLYLVNATGLQRPLVSAPVDLAIAYRPPAGKRVVAAEVATPDVDGQTGAATVTPQDDGTYRIAVRVDQFALVHIELAPAAQSAAAPSSTLRPAAMCMR